MPKMTLLEMTQDILNDMDSDEVNSITDTTEALQVAQIIKTTYYNIISSGREWPHLKTLFQLDSSGTVTKPTYMKLPANVIDIDWVKYNTRGVDDTKDKLVEIKYKTPEEFVALTDGRDSSNSSVLQIVDASGVKINVLTDKPPTYFTSFDDEYLVFDAYDSEVDDTLQNSKTQCHGKVEPTWQMDDGFTPDMPTQMFGYLLAESKATAFVTLKQSQNPKAEQTSITQRRRMSQEAWRIKNGITYPNFGRK